MPQFDVTVVGELNLDLILYGLPQQLELERELLADGLALTLGSSSAIFAHNLAVLGSKVGFISRIGTDPLGEIAIARLAAGGVDVSQVRKVPGPVSTGLTVILPRTGGRNILTYPGTMNEMCFEDLNLDYLADSKHFHLSSFFLHRASNTYASKHGEPLEVPMKNRLKVLRAERDWSQVDLAQRLEVSRQSVNAIETGKFDPSLPLAFKLARLFGMRIEEKYLQMTLISDQGK